MLNTKFTTHDSWSFWLYIQFTHGKWYVNCKLIHRIDSLKLQKFCSSGVAYVPIYMYMCLCRFLWLTSNRFGSHIESDRQSSLGYIDCALITIVAHCILISVRWQCMLMIAWTNKTNEKKEKMIKKDQNNGAHEQAMFHIVQRAAVTRNKWMRVVCFCRL